MAVERVRAAVTGLQDERNRLGWRPVASALENWRWRLLDGPVRARSPRFGVNRDSGSAALSTASASSSPSHSALKMKHMIPFRTFMSIEVGLSRLIQKDSGLPQGPAGAFETS